MSRSDGSGHGARRRTVLKLLSAAAGAAALPATGLGQSGESEFSVVQGESCVPVTPLVGDQPVEEFYDWREGETDYSSAGTTDLQRDDTSILFLYEGPNGTSLVLVHGHYGSNDSGGGSVSMTFTGLPEAGEWVVEDDLYDGDENYDNWNHDGTRSEIDWTYRFGRTDGGAFRGLEGEFELLIEPAFNDASAHGDEYYTSELADWQVLSGDVDDPDRTSLALDQPVTIRAGGCTTSDETGSGGTAGGDQGGDEEETVDSGDGEQEKKEEGEQTDEKKDEQTEADKEEEKETEEKEDEQTQREEETEDGDRREQKHEKQQRKHEKEAERKESKHEKKQRKHRKKHEAKQRKHRKKHEKKQRKHEKEANRRESKHRKKQRKHERKHEKKQRKHRKKRRKHRREDDDDDDDEGRGRFEHDDDDDDDKVGLELFEDDDDDDDDDDD